MKISEKSPIELRDMALRALKQSYERRGLTNVNVGKDSDNFVRFDAFAEVMYLALVNSESTADDIFADTASEEALLEHAKSLGIDLRPAEKASGNIICYTETADPVVIAAGDELTSSDGVLYEVVTGDTYFQWDYIPIIAVNAGEEGNLAISKPLQWVESKVNLSTFAYVDQIGITGGKPADTIDDLRTRIKERRALANVAGSPEHLISIAEDTSASIQKAFAYPALFGPGSGAIALQGYFNATSEYNKTISDYIVQEVSDAIAAVIPAEMKITVFSVAQETTDMVFKFDIPEPTPQGEGSGWIDESVGRFPAIDANGFCAITSYTSASQFIVNSLTTPTVGSHIAIWDSSNRKFIKAVVLKLVGQWLDIGIKTFEILIDKALAYQGVGMYVSPDCELIEDYGSYILNSFNFNGPGQATNDTARLPRSYRVPAATHSYYPKLGSRMFKGILNDFLEVNDIELSSSTSSPTVPVITNPPNVLVPRHIGIYPV